MIQPLNPFSNINFGYKSVLKDEFKRNPEMREHVKKGIYGGDLSTQDVSLEHLRPHSKGGGQNIGNMALATKALNEARGNDPLSKHLTRPMVDQYTKQFEGWQAEGFNNKQYVEEVRKTIQREGVDLGILNVKVGKITKRIAKQVSTSVQSKEVAKGIDVGSIAKQVGSEVLEHTKEVVKHIDFKA